MYRPSVLFFIFAVTALNLSLSSAKSILGSAVPVCDVKDPNLNQCIKSSSMKLLPRLAKGSREMDIPSLDPLFIPRMDIGQEAGAVHLKLELSDTVHTGLSKTIVEDVKMDMKNLVLTMKFLLPHYTLTGKYTGKGRILLLPLGGSGDANFTFTDLHLIMVASGSKKIVNGQEYLNLEKMKVTLQFKPGHNLLDLHRTQGDLRLAEQMRVFLRENADEVFSGMKDTLESVYADIMLSILRRTFNKVPLNKLFKNV